jgi:hypothetical protein
MPCEEHESLNRDWELKWRAEISAHDGYKGSVKSVLIERSRTNSERITAETRLVNHMKDCPVCQSEGRKPWTIDRHQPFH